ncbi:MAG: IclR family transcriptional regulator [Burkholderiaceae bacterium]|nr:IclR family transcriptional regulator [Burkholderiaceae bacterium]
MINTPDREMVSAVSTTQSLDRAMVLLEIVAMHASAGVSLGTAAQQAGLAKPTAHRLLTSMRNAGLVDYIADERLFYPAYKLFQLGHMAGSRFGLVQLARPILRQLAEVTEDTVYLTLRSGDSLRCVAREEGAYPIKILTLAEGDIRPLGLGSNGIAWLAGQTKSEFERLLQANHAALSVFPAFSERKLKGYVNTARRLGYAFSRGLMMPEMSAIAMCVCDPAGRPVATVSVAALTSRFDDVRLGYVRKELGRHVRMIESLEFDMSAAAIPAVSSRVG